MLPKDLYHIGETRCTEVHVMVISGKTGKPMATNE